MKRIVVFSLFHYLGLTTIFRALHGKGDFVILCYHNPTPEKLLSHLSYLKRHYTFISLKAAYEAKRTGKQLAGRSLVITLDDGFKENLALLPIFQAFNIKPTVFICSGIVNTLRGFWFMHLPRNIVQSAKKLSHFEREKLLQAHGFEFTAELAAREALNQTELQQMAEFIDFQAHTRFHPILPTCDDSTARHEIMDCRAELQTILHKEIEFFAYPNGSYSERDYRLVKEAGYNAALTTNPGFNAFRTDNYLLHRMVIPDDCCVAELASKTSGLWHRMTKLAKMFWK